MYHLDRSAVTAAPQTNWRDQPRGQIRHARWTNFLQNSLRTLFKKGSKIHPGGTLEGSRGTLEGSRGTLEDPGGPQVEQIFWEFDKIFQKFIWRSSFWVKKLLKFQIWRPTDPSRAPQKVQNPRKTAPKTGLKQVMEFYTYFGRLFCWFLVDFGVENQLIFRSNRSWLPEGATLRIYRVLRVIMHVGACANDLKIIKKSLRKRI